MIPGGKGPPLGYKLQSPERLQTKRCGNYIYSEHAKHISAQYYKSASSTAACSVGTKGTFVLTVGDGLALKRDLGVLSAGPELSLGGTLMGNERLLKGSIVMALGGV